MELEQAIYWLLGEGRWSRIVEILRRESPRTLDGACFDLLERYFVSTRRFRLRGKILDAELVASILRDIESDVAAGMTTRQATAKAGIPYQSYLRSPTSPVLRSLAAQP